MRNNCIEIEFYNLPATTRNRLGVTSVLLDITNNEAIRLTKNVEALTNANKLKTDGAQPFSAPSNPTNDAIFVEFLTPNVVDNRRQYYEVRVRIAGHPLQYTRLVVTGIPKTQGGEWSLELRRAPDHWIELAGTKKVNTIDYGTFELTKENIDANWLLSKWKNQNGDAVWIWPPMDYGNWCDRSLPVNDSQTTRFKALALEDLRPLISLPYLLKQGFCEIGWTLDGLIFDSDLVAGLYVYILNEEYYKAGSQKAVSTLQTVDIVGSGGFLQFSGIPFNTLDFSNMDNLVLGGIIFLAGIQNTLGIAYQYTFEFAGVVSSPSGSAQNITFHVAELDSGTSGIFTGEIIGEDVTVSIPAGSEKECFVRITVTLQPGQKAAIRLPELDTLSLTIKAGSRGRVYPDDKSFYTGQTINIQKAVENERFLLDYFKAFCHLTRSQAATDEVTKTVTLYPKNGVNVFGTNVAGFLLDEQPSVDISELVVQGSEQPKAVNGEQRRFLEVGFKDSTDSYIDSLKLTKEPYRRKILNSNLLPDETTEIYNPVFEPTLEGVDDLLHDGFEIFGPGKVGSSAVFPRLWDNDQRQRSFRIAPRLFYAYGSVKQKNPNVTNFLDEFASFFFTTKPSPTNVGLINQFAYASMLPTRVLEPAPDFYGNLVFEKQVYNVPFTPNSDTDMFNTFYLNISNELKGGFEIDLLMLMSMNFYNAVDFRRNYRFMFRGRPINAPMTQIRDFVGCSNIPTPATFFIPPTESECCELPCGCQFSKCEYYQDFGQFLRQTTLDALTITKFEVDGVSAITDPVGFGVIRIINILGKPYVSNLVDTLNSVGAPYMSFEYAYRLDPVKGARFFTIKKPVCQGFIIEISNATEVIYRYTESIQQQTWFGSGFSAFGYGGETYSEPENCTITTEY
jgi:hypothetical protein